MSTLVKPFTFSAGATIRASEHNNCFDTLFNDFNGNITNVNFSATASISDTQLSVITTSSKVNFSALTTTNQATGDLMFYSGTNLWTRFARGTANQSLKCQHDSQTVLLLHCDGIDGSTTFTDSSISVKTITANGNAQIDTAQSVFGGACGLFDGTGDYLSTPDSNDFNFASGDFTIDFRVRFNVAPVSVDFVGTWDDGNNHSWAVIYRSGGLRFRYATTQTEQTDISFGTWSPSTNTWYHIEISRNGDNCYCFVDSVQVGSTGNFSGATFYDPNIITVIGARYSSTGPTIEAALNGWMEEVRVSKGIARHTANFTLEIKAYQPSLIWVT